jgi:hypothetical protein
MTQFAMLMAAMEAAEASPVAAANVAAPKMAAAKIMVIALRNMTTSFADISAHAVPLPESLDWAIRVTGVRMRREEGSSISSPSLAGLGR